LSQFTISKKCRKTIRYVYPRWLKVAEHLKRIANSKSLFAADVKSYLTTTPIHGIKLTGIDKKNWTCRREKQLFPLYRIAYFLHPLNSKVDLTNSELKEIDTIFKQHIADFPQALSSFFDFRNHEGSFADGAVAWGYKKQPKLFWNCQETSSPTLALFARRLLTTIGNSVPSERAFSTMNYIHSKLRNRLSVKQADKLQYIFINCRAPAKQIALQPTTPTTEELLAIEELDEMGIGMVWEN
jgi:hypothetical protein